MTRLKKFANAGITVQEVYDILRIPAIQQELEASVKRNTESELDKLEQFGDHAVETIAEQIAESVSNDDEPFVSISEYLYEHLDLDVNANNELERMIVDIINEQAYELVDFDKIEEAVEEVEDPMNYNGDDSDIRREYWNDRL